MAEILKKQLGIQYDLRDLAMEGQIRLLEKSEKYGVIFLSFGPFLVALRNEQLSSLV